MQTQADEAEIALLGLCLTNQEALLQAVEELQPDMFTSKHQGIFRAICVVEKPDIALVAAETGKTGPGAAYLANLTQYAGFMSNLPGYIGVIRDRYIRRQMLQAGREITGFAQADEEISTLCGRAETLIYGLSDTGMRGKVYSALELVSDRWKEYDTKKFDGVSTGYRDLDDVLTGLQKSEVTVMAARPSMGKTALALNMAVNTAKLGSTVLFFSLEMAKEQLIDRIICAEARINSQLFRLKTITAEERKRAGDASEVIMSLPLMFDDSSKITVAEIRSKARRVKKQEGLSLVIIDYMQLIDTGRTKLSRNEAVGELARGLKETAKALNVPVIVLSQLSRQVENRQEKIPQLSDLRDSGEIEQVADVVIFPHREDYYEKDPAKHTNIADIYIAKQRNGPTGRVKLRYDKATNRFDQLAGEDRVKGVFGGVDAREKFSGDKRARSGQLENERQFAAH
jgi:replicative DNA helicase